MTDQRLTDDLLNELKSTPDPDTYLDSLESVPLNLGYHLSSLLDEKGVRRSDVIRRSALNETFGYQIFSGDRKPSRNKALQLAFGFPLNLEETQRLLKHAGVNELYPRNGRDAIIMFCIIHGKSLAETDDELFAHGVATIVEA